MSICKHINKDGICLLHSEPLYKEPCHEGPCTDYNPITNADRIRAMTDEELAELMMFNCECFCTAEKSGCMENDRTCKQAWLEWLKQEVDDES